MSHGHPMGRRISVSKIDPETSYRGSRGQNLVEFAVGLFVLLLIGFGVMDLARVFHSIIVVTSAAREGARFYTRNPNDPVGAQNAALNEAQNAGLQLSSAMIAATCVDTNGNGWCDGGQPATVTVIHSFSTIFGGLFAANPLTITRSAQMMVP
jgi:Flp pilus assembly protein TadG